METSETSKRAWWRRKRWWAVVGCWLVLPVLYTLGEGPVGYCVARGWVPLGVYEAVYSPGWRPAVKFGGPPDVFVRWHFWWVERGRAARRAEVRGRLATEGDAAKRAALERELEEIP